MVDTEWMDPKARSGLEEPKALRREPVDPADPAVLAAFARRRRRQRLIGIPALAVWGLWLGVRYHHISGIGEPLLVRLSLLMIAVVAISAYFNWRCPACNALLTTRSLPRGTCPKCGARLT